MADYEVVWDGRRQGPGGAQLFAPEVEPRPLPSSRRSPVRELVLSYLSKIKQPKTMVEVVAAVGCGMYAVNTALYRLRQEELVTIVGQHPERTRAGRVQHLYAATE